MTSPAAACSALAGLIHPSIHIQSHCSLQPTKAAACCHSLVFAAFVPFFSHVLPVQKKSKHLSFQEAGILLLSLILPDGMGGLHTDRDEYNLVSLSIILLFQNQDA
jgi:hypothetical protein